MSALCGNLSGGLQSLRLQRNNLSPSAGLVLSDVLARLPLRELFLDGNQLGAVGARHLADGLRKSGDKLRTLSLGSNGIKDDGCAALAEPLRTNNVLEQLLLGQGNQVKGPGLEAIAASLKANARSKLNTVLVDEEGASVSSCANLVFSLHRAGQYLRVGSLLRTGTNHLLQRGLMEGVLSRDKSRLFFLAPLTYCVRSLTSPTPLAVLCDFLIADRNANGSGGYVGGHDAKCALLEAILLPVEVKRAHVMGLMLGPSARNGVSSVELLASCLPAKMVASAGAAPGGHVIYPAARDRVAGGLWLNQPAPQSSAGPADDPAARQLLPSESDEEAPLCACVADGTQPAVRRVQLLRDNWLTGEAIEAGDASHSLEILSPQGQTAGSNPWDATGWGGMPWADVGCHGVGWDATG